MATKYTIAIVVAGLVFTLSGAASWGQVPSTNDKSDANLHFNTGGGTGALGSPMLSGTENTAYGDDALFHNTTGGNNTASGATALANNSTGSNNTASGDAALFGNTTGSYNTASGYNALADNTTGDNNTASGAFALVNNNGGNNTASGYKALYGNAYSYNNTATGAFALYTNTTGGENTATGRDALAFNATGYFNTAMGRSASRSNTRGDANTAHGYGALLANTTGSYNTALGYQALSNSTGSRNLALGLNAGIHLSSGDNNIYLGHTGFATESNTLRLGQVNSQTRTFIAGIAGVPISGAQVTINNAGQLGILASSARYKRDIQDMRESSQGLYQLRPVTFRYKQDAQGVRQYGLVAEEVAQVYPELVTRGADGKVESVQYHELIPMLLNEVQHQQQEIVELKAQNARSEAAQAQQLAELKAQNARLQAALVQQTTALAARLEQLEKTPHGATVATR